MNRQMMAEALRGQVPAGGGMVGGTQLSMGSVAPQPMGAAPMSAEDKEMYRNIGGGARDMYDYATTPTVAQAAQQYGPEVAKMGGQVTAAPGLGGALGLGPEVLAGAHDDTKMGLLGLLGKLF